jgi:hypothetical protein
VPITLPTLDDRRYADLRAETLARIPVHTPEWTNFNRGDPGVTLVELHAYLVETLLYRCNQIPARNRQKFLQLLQVPLNPAVAARGMVVFANQAGPNATQTLAHGAEVRAGSVPYRTEQGLDILPVEGMLFAKRELLNAGPELEDYYQQLYASYRDQPPKLGLRLYETVPFPPQGGGVTDIALETIDGSLWLALLTRPVDGKGDAARQLAREALAYSTLSFGVVPELGTDARVLPVYRSSTSSTESALRFYVPKVPADGRLPKDEKLRDGTYRVLDASTNVDVLSEPGVIQVNLPGAEELRLWTDLDPIEAGTRDLPPALDDTRIAERVITWIRIRFPARSKTRLRWAGLNAAMLTQRRSIVGENLPDGNGEPDQALSLAQQPVITGSVRLRVQTLSSHNVASVEEWSYIDDLQSAPPEVPRYDPQTATAKEMTQRLSSAKVFTVDAEAGRIRFGDGLHGARPPADARLEADYDVTMGMAGNVGSESVNSGPNLPPGVTLRNPVPTWGGADAEAVEMAEKRIPGYLRHRDRLVTIEDYVSIVQRTPGLDLARVEGLAAYNPDLPGSLPGDAPGAITLMLVPRSDPRTPDAPQPDMLFLDTVCKYVDPRRLVTTEVFLRGPQYVPMWLSVGISVKAGASIAEVREQVKRRLRRFLSPLPARLILPLDPAAGDDPGWPLNTPVVVAELFAEASREPAVQRINGIRLADGAGVSRSEIVMQGLELPRLLGITVTMGEPVDISELMGTTGSGVDETSGYFVPVPIVPGEC